MTNLANPRRNGQGGYGVVERVRSAHLHFWGRIGLVPLATALTGLILLTPAHAQNKSDTANERRIMADYAQCLVKNRRVAASRAILSSGSIDDKGAKSADISSSACLQSAAGFASRMRSEDGAMLGAIADALVRAGIGTAPTPILTSVPALTHREAYPVETVDKRNGKPVDAETLARREEGFRKAQMRNWLSRIGECVVRTDTAGARTALATRVTTPEEIAALRALSPALASCLPKDMTLSFDRTGLRGAIAINYYRLAMAARTAVQPAAKAP